MRAKITNETKNEIRIKVQNIRSPHIWQTYMICRQGDRFSIAYPGRASCYAWIETRIPLKGFGLKRIEQMVKDGRFRLNDPYRDPNGYFIRDAAKIINKARLILKQSLGRGA